MTPASSALRAQPSHGDSGPVKPLPEQAPRASLPSGRLKRPTFRPATQEIFLDWPSRALFKRVPTEELDDAVVGLVGGWVAERADGETFRSFCDRTTDDDLGRFAGREPAKARIKEAV